MAKETASFQCPCCEGGGAIWVLKKDGRKNTPDFKRKNCSVCEGTGSIEIAAISSAEQKTLPLGDGAAAPK